MAISDFNITIPPNKSVFIYKIINASNDIKQRNTGETQNTDKSKYELLNQQPMLLENNDFDFQISSTFDFLTENKSPKFLQLASLELSKKFGNRGLSFSGQFSKLNYKLWTKTDSLNLSLTVGLYMTTNAKDDVVIPAKKIINEVLPSEGGTLGSLIAPGVPISEVLADTFKGALAISIGKHWIYPCIIEKAQPTLSTETDDNDDPVWIKLQLDISTLTTATRNLLNSVLRG